MKIYIRFLRQGCVEAEVDDKFMELTDTQKLDKVYEILDKKTDDELIQAMSDFTDPMDGFFDATPQPSAIEYGEGPRQRTVMVETKEWETFCGIEAFEVVKKELN